MRDLFFCNLYTYFMEISMTNLGIISDDERAQYKFILTEEGKLYYGKCLWHKDLGNVAHLSPTTEIIGAGIVPDDLMTCSIDGDEWGAWKSTGYGVITPVELRFPIKEAFFLHKQTANAKQ